jgi:hypothetical protein
MANPLHQFTRVGMADRLGSDAAADQLGTGYI